jgi:hypothetical protein
MRRAAHHVDHVGASLAHLWRICGASVAHLWRISGAALSHLCRISQPDRRNFMKPETKGPQPKPGPVHPSPAVEATRQREKAEPAEVLGRHKNAGQKDHKGAR